MKKFILLFDLLLWMIACHGQETTYSDPHVGKIQMSVWRDTLMGSNNAVIQLNLVNKEKLCNIQIQKSPNPEYGWMDVIYMDSLYFMHLLNTGHITYTDPIKTGREVNWQFRIKVVTQDGVQLTYPAIGMN